MKESVTDMRHKCVRSEYGGAIAYVIRGAHNCCCKGKPIFVINNGNGTYACECSGGAGHNCTTAYDNVISPVLDYILHDCDAWACIGGNNA